MASETDYIVIQNCRFNKIALARVKNVSEDCVNAQLCPFIYRAQPQNAKNAREMGYLIPGRPTHLQEMQKSEFITSGLGMIYNDTCLRYDTNLNDFIWIGWNQNTNDTVCIPIKYVHGHTSLFDDGTSITCVTTSESWIALLNK